MKLNKLFFLFVLIALFPAIKSQTYIVDAIVGVVGKNQILYSDIEDQYLQLQAQNVRSMPDRCDILEEFLSQKLLVNQAEVDSIEVNEAEVEVELEQRISYFINQIGSEEKLIEYFGKSVLEIKEDMRDAIRDQLLMQRMRMQITADADITPKEVKEFYNKLPPDSIPNIDSEVEISQIVIYPSSSEEAIFEVKDKLLKMRERIMNGENFATLAVLYSECPSASKGGDLGWAAKAELDPSFTKAAFALKKGQVSKIVESAFGFHIIQLIDRSEDRVHTRHILLKPKISYEEKDKAKARLDSIMHLVRTDTLKFDRAAMYFSMDEDTRMSGGLRINTESGNTKFKISQFDTKEFYILRDLKVGEISDAFESTDNKGKVVFKTIQLKSKSEPHKANLKQDFELLKGMAMQKKEGDIVDNWVTDKIKSTYIQVNEPYNDCSFRIKGWLKK